MSTTQLKKINSEKNSLSSSLGIKGKLTRLPGKHFPGALPLLSRVCSLYGKGPQNNQHQDQTKLRLHSFLDYNIKTGLGWEKQMEIILDLILEDLT